ncbi:MAG: electron transfer flavoprotein subunit alpha/FixB family protein [Candidatus Brocadiaceae bacterium]|nr:electron transfer flavoprotein subunit alpha/FixB family protein [Candidatus Brocadiaceae bacterium]
MEEPKDVFVFAEVQDGAVAEVSLELLAKARELAGALGGATGAFLLGSGLDALPQTLFEHGCDEVRVADDPALAHYTTLPYADVLVNMIRRTAPAIVLFGATTTGRDLAPRVASALRVGLTADCTDLKIGAHRDAVAGVDYDKLLYQIRPAFGGNIIATIVNPETRPQMATVREGVMKMGKAEPGRSGRLVAYDGTIDPALRCVEILEEHRAERRVNLKKANVIVAGGAGVGSRENFELIRRLADALGAEVGASRAAVDAGYIDKPHQVGQTGTTVRPKLYVACGISGAVQHRAGMQEAGKIIAINIDPHAPIFQFAHYGIVGDLNQVIPALIEAYKEHAK